MELGQTPGLDHPNARWFGGWDQLVDPFGLAGLESTDNWLSQIFATPVEDVPETTTTTESSGLNITRPDPVFTNTSSSPPRPASEEQEDEDVDRDKKTEPDKADRPRFKITTACERCRRRKIKCDGRKPRCTRCERGSHDQCTYLIGSDGRKPPSQKLVNALLDRIAELEARSEALSESNIGRTQTASPTDTSGFVVATQGAARLFGPSSPFVVASDTCTPGVVPIASSSTVQPSAQVRGEFADCHPNSLPNYFLPMALEPSLHFDLLQHALAWGSMLHDTIDGPSFVRDLVAHRTGPVSDWSPLLHLSLLARGCRYLLSHPKWRDLALREMETLFLLAAKDMLVKQDLQNPGVSTVRATIILSAVYDARGDSRQGWIILKIGSSICEDSGLHVDCSQLVQRGKMTAKEARVRNRTFWAFFCAEQLWSLWLGRFALALEPASVPEIVVEDDLSEWRSTFGTVQTSWRSSSLASCVTLLALMKRLVHFLYNDRQGSGVAKTDTFRSLDVALLQWHHQLPSQLRIRPGSTTQEGDGAVPPQSYVMLAWWHCLVVLLHRTLCRPADPRDPSLVRCLGSSRAILDITKRWDDIHGLSFIHQQITQPLYTAGTLFVSVLAGGSADRAVVRDLDTTLVYLDHLGYIFDSSKLVARLLRNASESSRL